MITLLGSLLGFISSLVPEGMKMIQDKSDKSHEVTLLKLQMEAQKEGHTQKLEEIQLNVDATEIAALQSSYRTELKYTGWYAASVRPTVTYMIMLLFMTIEICAVLSLMYPISDLPWHAPVPLYQALPQIWGEEEQALFAAIISFWFGDRTIRRNRGR